MYSFLLVLHIIFSLLLIVVVLLQSGKSADLAGAFGGGGSQSTFGPRGAATILSKLTTILAILFMLNTFLLMVISKDDNVAADTMQITVRDKVSGAVISEAFVDISYKIPVGGVIPKEGSTEFKETKLPARKTDDQGVAEFKILEYNKLVKLQDDGYDLKISVKSEAEGYVTNVTETKLATYKTVQLEKDTSKKGVEKKDDTPKEIKPEAKKTEPVKKEESSKDKK